MVMKNAKFERMITPGEWGGRDMGQGRDIHGTSTVFAKYTCIFVILFCVPFYVHHSKRSRNAQVIPSHLPSLSLSPFSHSNAYFMNFCIARLIECTEWTIQTWFLHLGAYSLLLETFYKEVKKIVWQVLINCVSTMTEIHRGGDA